jgi:hypothetical protein
MRITSVRGKVLDISKFIEKHGNKRALGNAKMNARGDIIGPGGKIIKTSQQMILEYNRSNPKAVSKQVSLKNINNEIFKGAVEPAEAVRQVKEQTKEQATTKKRKLVDDDETNT